MAINKNSCIFMGLLNSYQNNFDSLGNHHSSFLFGVGLTFLGLACEFLNTQFDHIQRISGGEMKVYPSVKPLLETSYGLPNHGKFWSLFLKPSVAIWPSIFYQKYPIFSFLKEFFYYIFGICEQ